MRDYIKAPTVRTIDELGIKDRLKKTDPEALHYIKKLNEHLAHQSEITAKAVAKLSKMSIRLKDTYLEIKNKGDSWNDSHSCADLWKIVKDIVENR